ncbi:MAG: hypothetical protein KA807_10675 [Prolixibacteraceae bacterium]|nr:hypothetical protein [Prolixibacteraceae bacterium]
MKKLLFNSLLIFWSFVSFGQVTGGYNSNLDNLKQLSIDVENRNIVEGVYVDGSPYLEKEYIKGVFYLKNSNPIESLMRINLFKNNFEFEINKSVRVVDPHSIDSVICNSNVFLYKTFEYEGKTGSRIIKKLYTSGKASIYSFTQIVFKDAVKAEGYVEPKPPTFLRYDPVTIIEANDIIFPLTNFNKLYKTFPDKAAELKKFIKENKINRNDINDLKLLTAFLDKTI